MTDLYVKFDALNKSSNSIKGYQKRLTKISDNIISAKDTLDMSQNISESIISKLNSDIQKLEELNERIMRYSEALQSVSEIYNSSEKQLLNEMR